ncbi:MAG: DUF4410 domain-containing protein [Limisphaerales bacterium]
MKNQMLVNLSLAACAFAFFSGCASTKISVDQEHQGFLPQPSRVLIYNFAVSPDEVELDSGISGDIKELVNKTPRTDQERTIGRQLSEALAIHLVKEIGALGIPAIRAYTNVPVAGQALVIKGQFISVDEGNQAERVVIGLGAGRTDVRTLVEAYHYSSGKKVLLEEFGVNAKSGDKPGMAETMGVGALAGHLATSAVVSTGVAVGSEAFSANVEADADRTAKAIAKQLKTVYIGQGWINQ